MKESTMKENIINTIVPSSVKPTAKSSLFSCLSISIFIFIYFPCIQVRKPHGRGFLSAYVVMRPKVRSSESSVLSFVAISFCLVFAVLTADVSAPRRVVTTL